MVHPLNGRRGLHELPRTILREQLIAVHERLERVCIRFLQNEQDVLASQWRQRVIAYLEASDLDGAWAELERMRAAAPDAADAVLPVVCQNEGCRLHEAVREGNGGRSRPYRTPSGWRKWTAEFWEAIDEDGNTAFTPRDRLQLSCPDCAHPGLIIHG